MGRYGSEVVAQSVNGPVTEWVNAVIDIVFSLDSVITAVGMVEQIWVMVAAVVTSVGLMLLAAKPIGDFVSNHPLVKVLALSFLVMVGMALTAGAFDVHVPKAYIYASMAFSLVVEALICATAQREKRRQMRPIRLQHSSPYPSNRTASNAQSDRLGS